MIKLSKFNMKGTKVHYDNGKGIKQNGMIKSIHPEDKNIVFVVFECDNEWKLFSEYTAKATKIVDLYPGWLFTTDKDFNFEDPDDGGPGNSGKDDRIHPPTDLDVNGEEYPF